jgi:hypothetical protein
VNVPLSIQLNALNKIKERKYEYPHQINEVPVQTHFFYHFIVASALVHSGYRIIENQEVQQHPTEYVEAVETCNKEKEACKIRWTILIKQRFAPKNVVPSATASYRHGNHE